LGLYDFLNIFEESLTQAVIYSKKVLFEMEIFYNIINVFTVTFD